MPAVNPLSAILAPASLPSGTARSGLVLQDLLSARAAENTGVQAESREREGSREPAEKPFARELEKGLEQQSEQRESRRSARAETVRRATQDRKEDAAAQADGGKALPPDGRPLPPVAAPDTLGNASALAPQAVVQADVVPVLPSDPELVADTTLPPAVVTLTEPTPTAPALTDTALVAAMAALPPVSPVPATDPGMPVTEPLATAAPVLPVEQPQSAPPLSPAAALATASELTPLPDPNAAPGAAQSTASAAETTAPAGPLLTQDTRAPATPILDAALPAGSDSAPPPGSAMPQSAATDSNPFASLAAASDADAMQLAQQQAASQQQAAARQAQNSADALAQAQGSEPGSLLDSLPAQGDLAERVRAWRGLSAVEGMAMPSLTGREAASPSLFSQTSSQLQQFADALRMAVNQAEAPSLLPAAERSTSPVTGTPATAPGALSGTATAAPADAGGAWRADSLQMPALTPGARPAAGTLPFQQLMQPSSFGAPLGETFGQNAWAESVTQRVALMTGLKISSARIELDPPELGAMTVKVSVSGDQASVSFVSPHANVRDALEQTFPRLQEMLGQQGLQLADAQVSDQSAERRQSGSAAPDSRSDATENGDERGESLAAQNAHVATSLIDYYA